MAFLDPALNPVLQPLLNWSPFLGILVLALILSFLVTIIYKYFTNQEEMKRLKEQQKEYQKQIKSLKDKPDEMMKVQKEAMKISGTLMKQSFKPTLITMLPMLLIFGWMSSHLTYEPIYPSETYGITAVFEKGVTGDAELVVSEGTELLSDAIQMINSEEVTWRLKSSAGDHFLTIKTANDEQTKKVRITEDLQYEDPLGVYPKGGDITRIQINYNKLKPLGNTSLLGWQPGWLGLYIIFSILFSMILRKAMKVY